MNNYQDFILDKLINEAYLSSSAYFLDRLRSLYNRSKIARVLYDLFEFGAYIYQDLPQNYIDVSGEDSITFLSDEKSIKARNLSLSPYLVKGRGEIKIGRFVNALLSNSYVKKELFHIGHENFEFTPKDIEDFVNLYKSTNTDSSKKFKLVKGEEIDKWYNLHEYSSDRGTLGSSCMKNVDKEFFDIYTENTDVCSLLIYLNSEDKLLGRALVWKLNDSPCEAKYFMDRVYTSNDSDVLKFIKYAEDEGWLYRNRMNSSAEDSLLFRYNGKPVFGKISVKLKFCGFDKYPYLDTLTFLDIYKLEISNVGSRDCLTLDATDGDTYRCDNCGGIGEIECAECDNNGKVDCRNCDGAGEDEDGEECPECQGTGLVICPECEGDSNCPECTGLEKCVKELIKSGHYPDYKNAI
jgi:hypothetical protein